ASSRGTASAAVPSCRDPRGPAICPPATCSAPPRPYRTAPPRRRRPRERRDTPSAHLCRPVRWPFGPVPPPSCRRGDLHPGRWRGRRHTRGAANREPQCFLEAADGLGVLIQLGARCGPIPIGIGVLRVEPYGFVVVPDGPLVVLLLIPGVTPVVEGGGVLG